MRGTVPFDPEALQKAQHAVLRPDRPTAGLSVAELAELVGTTRHQISSYLQGRAVPEPPRLKALADAVGVPPSTLTGVADADATLADLRRHAGLTLKTAAARARATLTQPTVRCSAWLLSELEAGRVPGAWSTPAVRARVAAALAEVYAEPEDRITALWPLQTTESIPEATDLTIATTEPPPAPAFRLVGPSIFTWYAKCPSCELVAPPSSGSYTMRRDKSVDWSRPAELRCSQCGTQHLVTPFELQPHDATVTCVRATCRQTFPAPSTAVEATCEHCSLVNHGPAALADPDVHHQAATVRYDHTLQMQAKLAAAKERARAHGLGGIHPLLLDSGE